MSAGVTAYARPADTLDGVQYPAEAMLVAPDNLEDDSRMLDAIPLVTGGKVGTIGCRISEEARRTIQDAIDRYAVYDHDASFVLLDLSSGCAIYYNTGLVVYSASCVKGPYIISCLEAGIDATNDMYLAGHYSDNEAYSRIRQAYGSAVYADWLWQAGVDPTLAAYHYCHLTSLDLARMWLAAYPYVLGGESGSSSARQILQGSRNSAIEMTLGGDRTVYSKAGWISSDVNPDYNVYNVGGIVMGEHPYLLSVTSTARGGTAEAETLVAALDAAHEALVADLAATAAAGDAETDTTELQNTEPESPLDILTRFLHGDASGETDGWFYDTQHESSTDPGGE